jgi:hypothetical protein
MHRFSRFVVAAMAVALILMLLTFTNGGLALAEQMHPLLVQVVNSASEPVPTRDVDRPANQPFQVRLTGFSITDGFRGDTKCITVPSGKRLVVEFASAEIGAPSGQNPSVLLFAAPPADCDNDEAVIGHRLITVVEEPNVQTGRDLHVATQSVRLYVNSGDLLGVTVGRAEFTGQLTGQVNVTGYLIDAP